MARLGRGGHGGKAWGGGGSGAPKAESGHPSPRSGAPAVQHGLRRRGGVRPAAGGYSSVGLARARRRRAAAAHRRRLCRDGPSAEAAGAWVSVVRLARARRRRAGAACPARQQRRGGFATAARPGSPRRGDVSWDARDGARAARRRRQRRIGHAEVAGWRRDQRRWAAWVAVGGQRGGGGAVASARPPLGLAAVWSALAAGSSFPWLARRSLCSKSSSPSLWGASRHGEGVGRSTRKTQVAKARLFPVRSHRSDSTWRLKGGVAEVAWVSVLGRGGGVVFLVVDQANPVWGAPPLSTGSFLTGWWRWSVDKENSGCRGNVVPCPDSLKSDSTGKPAGGVAEAAWVSYLAEVVGAVAVLSLARLEAGRRWGVGWVW